MSRIFVLSHPRGRYHSDFGHLSETAQYCDNCGGRIDCLKSPLRFYWDLEFQGPGDLDLDDRQFYWGSFLLIVTDSGRRMLSDFSEAFEFCQTRLVATDLADGQTVVQELPEPKKCFYWALPKNPVVVTVSGEPNSVCTKCGKFVDHPRQLTRMMVDQSKLPLNGVFSVAQNRGRQVFVTEETKLRLLDAGVDAGFFAAGRVV